MKHQFLASKVYCEKIDSLAVELQMINRKMSWLEARTLIKRKLPITPISKLLLLRKTLKHLPDPATVEVQKMLLYVEDQIAAYFLEELPGDNQTTILVKINTKRLFLENCSEIFKHEHRDRFCED
ncbi:MAG: hypothetical protein ACQCN6_01570 [Candidatus Bathyarchaeia archaeon]|jgi:hypothetical protein